MNNNFLPFLFLFAFLDDLGHNAKVMYGFFECRKDLSLSRCHCQRFTSTHLQAQDFLHILKKLVYIISEFTLCQYLTRAPAIQTIYFSKNLSLAHITWEWKKLWIIVARIDSSRMLRIAERISPKTSEALFKPIHYLKAEENQSKHINECTWRTWWIRCPKTILIVMAKWGITNDNTIHYWKWHIIHNKKQIIITSV